MVIVQYSVGFRVNISYRYIVLIEVSPLWIRDYLLIGEIISTHWFAHLSDYTVKLIKDNYKTYPSRNQVLLVTVALTQIFLDFEWFEFSEDFVKLGFLISPNKVGLKSVVENFYKLLIGILELYWENCA